MEEGDDGLIRTHEGEPEAAGDVDGHLGGEAELVGDRGGDGPVVGRCEGAKWVT
jgi:hypothetical protein